MSDEINFYQWQGEDLCLRVLLQPKASSNEFVGVQENRLKIRLTAPPVDGKANQQLIEFLAKQFKVPKRQVAIERGELARQKWVRINSPTYLPSESWVVKA